MRPICIKYQQNVKEARERKEKASEEPSAQTKCKYIFSIDKLTSSKWLKLQTHRHSMRCSGFWVPQSAKIDDVCVCCLTMVRQSSHKKRTSEETVKRSHNKIKLLSPSLGFRWSNLVNLLNGRNLNAISQLWHVTRDWRVFFAYSSDVRARHIVCNTKILNFSMPLPLSNKLFILITIFSHSQSLVRAFLYTLPHRDVSFLSGFLPYLRGVT